MVLPAETASTIMPTVTRMPRMQGLPPITSGSIVIRGSNCTPSRYRVYTTYGLR